MRRNLLALVTALVLAFTGTLAVAQVDNSGPNCEELGTAEAMQAAIDEYGADTYDADGDGFACEETINYQYEAAGGSDEVAESEDDGTPCNVETGEPGEGEGVYADGECISQEGGEQPVEGGSVPAPVRVDTGGGYCAASDC